MTIDEFNKLDEQQKRFLVCDAEKFFEKSDDFFRYEWFILEDFWVEVKVSYHDRYKREIIARRLQELAGRQQENSWTFSSFAARDNAHSRPSSNR